MFYNSVYLHETFVVKKCPNKLLAPGHLHFIKSGPLCKKFGHPCFRGYMCLLVLG